jgi:hypothetical protein
MKLTPNVLNTLKNFHKVSSSVVIQPGNKISVLSNDESIFAIAETDVTFDNELCIFDLPSFLSITDLFEAPELSWRGTQDVVISDNTNTYSFRQGDSTFIRHTEKLEIPMDDLMSFDISGEQYSRVVQAAAALRMTMVCFYTKDNNLYFSTFDKDNTSTEVFSVMLASDVGYEFKLFLDISKALLLKDNYKVTLDRKRLLLRFQGELNNVTYWTSAEADSELPSEALAA